MSADEKRPAVINSMRGKSWLRELWRRVPNKLSSHVTAAAWASLIVQVVLIGTGGAVRLTSSGLGCPTWPLCTPESLISTPEMGIHGIIEFGNRMLTGVVGIAAVTVLVLVVKIRRERQDLFRLALAVVLGVAAQAVVGGITVLTGLNPFVVGFHYLASITLVCLCSVFLVQVMPTSNAVPKPTKWLETSTWMLATTTAVTVVLGVLTTGAGPHSGDPLVGRSGFDATLLQHVHAWPSYALVFLTVVLTIVTWVRRMPIRTLFSVMLVLEILQIVLGLYQARSGLPPLAVGAHMVLAAMLAATVTVATRLVVKQCSGRTANQPGSGSRIQ